MNKPKLGQHFLLDQRYISKAVQSAEIGGNEAVVEVGPGKGALTKELLKYAKLVLALEIDERLANRLHERLGEKANLEIRVKDVRFTEWSEVTAELRSKGYEKVKLVANLPYYLASQMVIHALAAKPGFDCLVVMVQDEVAKRMCAVPGSKEYSSFSVAVQYYGIPKYLVKVSAQAFNPPPKVSSALVLIEQRTHPLVEVSDPDQFFFLVQSMFTHRRKTLRNCLLGIKNVPTLADWERSLQQAGIDSHRRPETLSMQEMAALYKVVELLPKV